MNNDKTYELQVIKDVIAKRRDKITKESIDAVVKHNADRTHTASLVMYSRILKELREIEQELIYHFTM